MNDVEVMKKIVCDLLITYHNAFISEMIRKAGDGPFSNPLQAAVDRVSNELARIHNLITDSSVDDEDQIEKELVKVRVELELSMMVALPTKEFMKIQSTIDEKFRDVPMMESTKRKKRVRMMYEYFGLPVPTLYEY